MTEEFFCPACGEETEHEILKEASDLLVKCSICGNIHHVKREEEPKEISVKSIVSMEHESAQGVVELLEDEFIEEGKLLVAEVDGEAFGVEVTSIEIGAKRVHDAFASEIDTLWTRVIDNVVVKISYHDGWKTYPLYAEFGGEEDIEIGKVYNFDKYKCQVTHIKLRNGSMMRKEGWKAYARKIKRVYSCKPTFRRNFEDDREGEKPRGYRNNGGAGSAGRGGSGRGNHSGGSAGNRGYATRNSGSRAKHVNHHGTGGRRG